MKILVATVGGSEEPVILAARKIGLDKAILITGKPARDIFDEPVKNDIDPIAVSDRIKNRLEHLGAAVEILQVNPFDFEDVCLKTLEVLEKARGNEVSVVISGGTKIQALAASYAAFMCGCKMYYTQETVDGADLVEIPVTLGELDRIPDSRKSVLLVMEDGDDAATVTEKLNRTGSSENVPGKDADQKIKLRKHTVKKKTVSQYLKELREYGLIEQIDQKSKNYRYRLTFAGKIAKLRWKL